MEWLKSLYLRIRESLQWHFFPTQEELKVKSVVEFVFFLIILLAFFFAYYAGNRVPVRNIYFRVEKLAQSDTIHGVEKVIPTVSLSLPMTSTNLDTINKLFLNIKYNTYIIDYEQDAQQKKEADSLLRVNNLSSKIVQNRKLSLLDGNIPLTVDSLKCIFNSYYNNNKRSIVCYSFGFNKGPNSMHVCGPSHGFSPTIEHGDTTYMNLSFNDSPRKYLLLTRITSGNISKLDDKYEGSGDVLAKPCWYRLEDISQSYYKIRLNTETIDSLILKLDFTGVTEFSNMDPEPDEIDMSSIVFKDKNKIRKIQADGLTFHATFKELQNMQSVRMFFVSAGFGSVLFTFLIFFFIIIYRWCKFIKLSLLSLSLAIIYLFVFVVSLQICCFVFRKMINMVFGE
jgi:hypothetical protein